MRQYRQVDQDERQEIGLPEPGYGPADGPQAQVERKRANGKRHRCRKDDKTNEEINAESVPCDVQKRVVAEARAKHERAREQ